MLKNYLFCLFILLLFTGCQARKHSTQSNVTLALLERDKAAYVAVEHAPDEDAITEAGALVTKTIAPFCSKVMQSGEAETVATALANAADSDVNYLFLIGANTWTSDSDVLIIVKVYDVVSGNILREDRLDASCPNGPLAPGECLRPTVTSWAPTIFRPALYKKY